MKQTEQPNSQWNLRVEHEFRSADQMSSTYEGAHQVDGEQTLEQQQPACLPGEQERALEPERGGDEEIAEITEEKKILRSVLPPVQRDPRNYAYGPDNLEPERDAHERVLYPPEQD